MNESKRDRIAARAHQIWEAEGRPDNRAEEHWRRAEQDVAEQEKSEQMSGHSDASATRNVDSRPAPPIDAAPPMGGSDREPDSAPPQEGGQKPQRKSGRSRTPRPDPQRR